MNIDMNNQSINGANKSGVHGASSGGIKKDSPSPQVTATNHSDSVSLSPSGMALGELERAAKNSPDVDMERVEAIQSALRDGSFTVDANQLSNDILRYDEQL